MILVTFKSRLAQQWIPKQRESIVHSRKFGIEGRDILGQTKNEKSTKNRLIANKVPYITFAFIQKHICS